MTQQITKANMDKIIQTLDKACAGLQNSINEAMQIHSTLTTMRDGITHFVVNNFEIPSDQIQTFPAIEIVSIEPQGTAHTHAPQHGLVEHPDHHHGKELSDNKLTLLQGVLAELFKDNQLVYFIRDRTLISLLNYVKYSTWVNEKNQNPRTDLVKGVNENEFIFHARLNQLVISFKINWLDINSSTSGLLTPIFFGAITEQQQSDTGSHDKVELVVPINLNDVSPNTLFEMVRVYEIELMRWVNKVFLATESFHSKGGGADTFIMQNDKAPHFVVKEEPAVNTAPEVTELGTCDSNTSTLNTETNKAGEVTWFDKY
jgi:hypothetical protein